MLKQLPPSFCLLLINIISVWPSAWCFVTNGLIWSKHQQEFVSLYSLPWYGKLQRDYLELIQDSMEHCNGEKIRVAYFQDGNLINFYDNDTKVGGIYGEIWNLLAFKLNFTLVPYNQPENNSGTRLCNGTYTGLLGLLQKHKIHSIAKAGLFTYHMDILEFTMPVLKTRHRLFIRPVYKLDNSWIITLFSPKTWYCVFSLFIVISVAGYIFQSTEPPNKKFVDLAEQHKFSLFEHIFYTFSLICAQGYIPTAFYNSHKLLSFSKSFFCWLILIASSSHLIYRMTNRTLNPPFTNFEDLLNSTNFVLLTFKGSLVLKGLETAAKNAARNAGVLNVEKRLSYADTTEQMYMEACFSNTSYAMLEAADRYMANGRFICRLTPVGPAYFETWVVLLVVKGFRYKKLFNATIMKLWQYGILCALRNRFLKHEKAETPINTFKTIDMNQVQLIFLILCYGIALSMVIFLVEYIIFLYRMRYGKKVTSKKNVLR